MGTAHKIRSNSVVHIHTVVVMIKLVQYLIRVGRLYK